MKLLTKDKLVLIFATSTFVVAACSEARDEDDGTGGAGATTSTTTSSMQGTGGNTTTDTSSSTTTGGMGGMAGGGDYMGIVINEVSVDGEDWIELYNTTSDAVTFPAGFRLTDFDDQAMGPKIGAEFNGADLSGQTISAGGYLLALSFETDFDCATSAPVGVPCVEFGAGLSQTNGDTVYLIDMADTVIMSESVAAMAVGDGAGETWGRFPNGTGAFAVLSTSTLGDANAQ